MSDTKLSETGNNNVSGELPPEVVVVGGGMVGAGLACLLGIEGIRVLLLDARDTELDSQAVGRGKPAVRVSALSPVSQCLLEWLGVWKTIIARRATPYDAMQVWDAAGSGEVNFIGDQAGLPVLGHIVENDVVVAALETRLAELPNVQQRFGVRVSGLESQRVRYGDDETDGYQLVLENGETITAPLIVAADGARSALRDMAGIGYQSQDTGHVAVVTTVRNERVHGGVARQAFVDGSPLAFLPLTVDGDSRYSSIVWSTTPAHAKQLQALPAEELGRALAAGIDHRLGETQAVDRAYGLPLTQRHADQYHLPGLVLVGDAAHSIHPLAGQGVNLGLMDAAVLAEEWLLARKRGLPAGHPLSLARYARRRRGDNASMLKLMESFWRLFGAEHPALTLMRNMGMSGIDRLGLVKRLLLQQASGQRGRLPLSCRKATR
ncbi:FAD-dependent monooxygenase [Halomonas halocynthiae]|uniref:FAD-dependent monooxygenase n=1 Tax=Halomonas halocynthiae TaxID=176290 RepID=UPI000415AD64|nr:FAD-dependent monooxygenase [Halomonas halocynthiae]